MIFFSLVSKEQQTDSCIKTVAVCFLQSSCPTRNNGSTCLRSSTSTKHPSCIHCSSCCCCVHCKWTGAGGLFQDHSDPAMQRTPPLGSSSQGSPGGRHGVTICSKQPCQMSNLLHDVSCIPHQVCNPQVLSHISCPAQCVTNRLNSGCLFSAPLCSA